MAVRVPAMRTGAEPSACRRRHAFRVVTPGVGRAREELAALIPSAARRRVDAATRRCLPSTCWSAPKPCCTGSAAVGDRPVALVAFLELDQELLAPRDRAAEQALWLLVRAARLLVRPVRGRDACSCRPGCPTTRRHARPRPAIRRPSPTASRRREPLALPAVRWAGRARGRARGRRRRVRRAARRHVDRARPEATAVRSCAHPSTAGALRRAGASDLAPARSRCGRLRVDVDPLSESDARPLVPSDSWRRSRSGCSATPC